MTKGSLSNPGTRGFRATSPLNGEDGSLTAIDGFGVTGTVVITAVDVARFAAYGAGVAGESGSDDYSVSAEILGFFGCKLSTVNDASLFSQ